MDVITVVFTDKDGRVIEHDIPSKGIKRHVRKMLKDSYEPGYFGVPFDAVECPSQGWSLGIDSDLSVYEI